MSVFIIVLAACILENLINMIRSIYIHRWQRKHNKRHFYNGSLINPNDPECNFH